jgi:hypothetical protein
MKKNLQENIDTQLSPTQVEEFLLKAGTGHNLTLETVSFSSQQVVSSELEVQGNSVHLKLSSGNLQVIGTSSPKLVLNIKLRALTGAYITVEDTSGERGFLHLEFGRTEVVLEFTVNVSVQQVLDTF